MLNETQQMWLEIIKRVLTASRFDPKRGDLDYVFRNMLAKHTSSQDSYHVSLGVEKLILSDKTMLAEFERKAPINLRRLFYGKKSRAYMLGYPTMFEHAIPAAVLRGQLLKIRSRFEKGDISETECHDQTEKVLINCGEVVIILKEENSRLSRSSMPDGWVFGESSVFARYDAATPRVDISKQFIAYRDGKICR